MQWGQNYGWNRGSGILHPPSLSFLFPRSPTSLVQNFFGVTEKCSVCDLKVVNIYSKPPRSPSKAHCCLICFGRRKWLQQTLSPNVLLSHSVEEGHQQHIYWGNVPNHHSLIIVVGLCSSMNSRLSSLMDGCGSIHRYFLSACLGFPCYSCSLGLQVCPLRLPKYNPGPCNSSGCGLLTFVEHPSQDDI